jgi:hypothetical protein
VLGTIHCTFFRFFIFSNNNSHQNILTFFHFLYHIIIFYYYLNKKFTKIQNFFTFLYKFLLLYITSSFLINFKINNPTTLFCTCLCQTTLMSSDNSPPCVRQRTKELVVDRLHCMRSRQVLSECNLLRADLRDPVLLPIAQMLMENHWEYLYNCACLAFPRLVREFYGNMIIIQEDDRGLIMQTMVRGQQIQIDPQFISVVIGVPVLLVSGVPFPDEAPSIDFLHDFFGTRPQREDKSHSQINIGAFAPMHRFLAKIVVTILWPQARRSELTFKKATLLYAIMMRTPF